MGGDEDDPEEEDNDLLGPQSSQRGWTKGVADPDADSRVNIWSLNGFGQPVFTGGMYQPDEARILEKTVKNYCSSKNISLSELCGGEDHTVHNKSVRGAWQEIAQCLPHRTVLSVYKRALRQMHGMTRGAWSKEEVDALFRLVDLHGHRWKTIQDKLGRTATDCRVKFFDMNDQFRRGKWSVDDVELLLREVRATVNAPRHDMDVREINAWTLENRTKIPWTSISSKVNRRRIDCYFKWKQMTRRSNKKAKILGLEPVPMSRDLFKFDVRAEYVQWKAEQDPKWRQKYANEYILPLLQQDGGIVEREQDIQLVDSIIESRATRPSEVSWHAIRGDAPRERWEALIDEHAPDDDLDLPLWKLAKVVRASMAKNADSSVEPGAITASANNDVDDSLETYYNSRKISNETTLEQRRATPTDSPDNSESIMSGVSIDLLQKSINEIVDNSNDDITIKGVRRLLETKHGIDLSLHKRRIKQLIKQVVVNDH
ncbi:hypothetical protein ACHAWU_006919 [Discostella pseudostelligera]|uniref:Uncharacterized protein n=1 Tax=Discostella pseudostelligera TaxID=259834 RepID=A0ABD3N0M0_9STRA